MLKLKKLVLCISIILVISHEVLAAPQKSYSLIFPNIETEIKFNQTQYQELANELKDVKDEFETKNVQQSSLHRIICNMSSVGLLEIGSPIDSIPGSEDFEKNKGRIFNGNVTFSFKNKKIQDVILSSASNDEHNFALLSSLYLYKIAHTFGEPIDVAQRVFQEGNLITKTTIFFFAKKNLYIRFEYTHTDVQTSQSTLKILFTGNQSKARNYLDEIEKQEQTNYKITTENQKLILKDLDNVLTQVEMFKNQDKENFIKLTTSLISFKQQ